MAVSANSEVNLCLADAAGRRYCAVDSFRPFLWTSSKAESPLAAKVALAVPAGGVPPTPLDTLMDFLSPADMEKYFRSRDKYLPVNRISSPENQYLTHCGARMFADVPFSGLRRMQLDIETNFTSSFPDAKNAEDRILAVGISGCGGAKFLTLEDFSDEAEKKLLNNLRAEIVARDPDIIEGHNIFNFDLPYIAARCARTGASMQWGRFGGGCAFRKSRLSIAERTYAYNRCDIAGRTVVDTLILVQLYDVSVREMASYSLKESAIHFGISDRSSRTYLTAPQIRETFKSDRRTFLAYLEDDVRETGALSALLLPTYVAQVRNFPMTLQECLLRGSGMKVESLFLEKYYACGAALPCAARAEFFEGALSQSFETGVFKKVLHYDVASLYPSLLLAMGRNPKNDYLGKFLPELERLRAYRLKYKNLAKTEADPSLAAEYSARQKSFKILINSFYGYLGLSTATFSDTELASLVTKRGRDLLSALIERFRALGYRVLEADTDGIYIQSDAFYGNPQKLLEHVADILPKGVDLEFDGKYPAMLCYKAKNYALLEESGAITMRGSALRNRSTEPFLRMLTQTLVRDLLLSDPNRADGDIRQVKSLIESGMADIRSLAKSEYIGKSCAQYEAEIAATGKGRRASMEAALQLSPRPIVGDRVSYYITRGAGKSPDWKRARPVELYDARSAPYDVPYYLAKLADWRERFADLIGLGGADTSQKQESPTQTEFPF